MSFLAELLASLVTETAAGAAEGPVARFLEGVRRRVTLPLVGLAWLGALALMVAAWVVGVGNPSAFWRGAAIIVFLFALLPALVLTRLWIGRRGA
jgi:hypothetical protein